MGQQGPAHPAVNSGMLAGKDRGMQTPDREGTWAGPELNCPSGLTWSVATHLSKVREFVSLSLLLLRGGLIRELVLFNWGVTDLWKGMCGEMNATVEMYGSNILTRKKQISVWTTCLFSNAASNCGLMCSCFVPVMHAAFPANNCSKTKMDHSGGFIGEVQWFYTLESVYWCWEILLHMWVLLSVIYWVKMSNICWFQPLKGFLAFLCHLWVLGCWLDKVAI